MKGTAEATLKAIVETSSLAENELGLNLKREGVCSRQIMEWRADVIEHIEIRPRAYEVIAPRTLLR